MVLFHRLRELAQVERLLLSPGADDEHASFVVQCPDLADFDATLAHTLVHFPRLLLPIFEEALVEAQSGVHKHPAFAEKHEGQRGSVKRLCHIRLFQLPPFPELHKQTLSMLRSDEFDHLVQISGTIVRTGSVRVLELSKEYQCMKPRCGHRFRVFADPEQSNLLPTPQSCPAIRAATAQHTAGTSANAGKASSGSEAEGGEGPASSMTRCNSTQLSEVAGSRECIDYQEIRIQDKVDAELFILHLLLIIIYCMWIQMESLKMGSVPRSMTVLLEADLADKYNAGDDVLIVGSMVRRWAPVAKGMRCNVDIAIRANRYLSTS